MKRLKIYLAGGMNGISYDEQNKWREYIRQYLKETNERGGYNIDLYVINPCKYYNFEHKRHESELEVMTYDLNHVRSSDLIIVNFNVPNSIGTAMEIALAYELRIPVLGINKDNISLHPWLENSCNRIFNSINSCLEYVEDFYIR